MSEVPWSSGKGWGMWVFKKLEVQWQPRIFAKVSGISQQRTKPKDGRTSTVSVGKKKVKHGNSETMCLCRVLMLLFEYHRTSRSCISCSRLMARVSTYMTSTV
jgi:hypothetical protein